MDKKKKDFMKYVSKRNGGMIPCFFCDSPILGEPVLVKLKNREVLAHAQCARDYKKKNPADIDWWWFYIAKLSKYEKYKSLYKYELNKIEKKWKVKKFIKSLWPFSRTSRP